MTNKGIVQALRCCAEGECKDCQIYGKIACVETLCKYALDLIERLTAENTAMLEKQAKAEAERDALIEQIKERHDCLDCKHNDFCEFDGAFVVDCMNCVQEECQCAGCCDSSRWEWRGLPEAPEVK